jgi:hypothetical protein
LPKFAYEPPPGTWNISSSNTLAFVRTALTQAAVRSGGRSQWFAF